MNLMLVLYKKEIKSFFTGPFLFIVTAFFSLMMGWFFFNSINSLKEAYSDQVTLQVVAPMFGTMNILLIFVCPLMTMRLFSEEKKLGTLDHLLNSKLTLWQITLGKFLAAFSAVLFIISFTLIFPIILFLSGHNQLDMLATGYLGIFLNIACYISLSLFASSLTDNQLVAATLSFCFLFSLLILIVTASSVENVMLADLLRYMSYAFHFEGLAKGEIRSFSLVYYACFIGISLFVSKKSLEVRFW